MADSTYKINLLNVLDTEEREDSDGEKANRVTGDNF